MTFEKQENTKPITNFEKIIQQYVAPIGKWQLGMYLLLALPLGVPYILIPAFTLLTPPYRCTISAPIFDWTNISYDLSYQEINKIAIPHKNANEAPMVGQDYQPCLRFKHNNLSSSTDDLTIYNETEGCLDGYTFDLSSHEYVGTVIHEFNLVCDKKYWASLSVAIYQIGQFIACFVAGYLSDRHGRKITLTVTGYILLISSATLTFVPDIITYIAMQFVIGFSYMGFCMTVIVYMYEITYGTGNNVVVVLFSVAILLIPSTSLVLLSYAFQNWRWVNGVISLTVLPVLLIPFLLDESPRWLFVKGRKAEAVAVLKKVSGLSKSHFNGTELIIHNINTKQLSEAEERNSENDEIDTNKTFVDTTFVDTLKSFGILFTERSIRRISILSCFVWFANCLVYYGIVYNSSKIQGDFYLVFWFMNCIGVVGSLLNSFIINRLGRRTVLVLFYCLSVPIMFLIILLQISNIFESSLPIIILSVIVKFFLDISFSALYTITPEHFPTEIRNYGVGMSSGCARLGSTISPFVILLGETVWRPLTLSVFMCVLIVNIGITWHLPETKGRPMPDWLSEVEVKNTADDKQHTHWPSEIEVKKNITEDEYASLNVQQLDIAA